MPKRCLFTLCLITALSPAPTHAHNGAMAIAVPVEGVEVDGDLSDWPAGMRRYPITLPEFGVSPRDGKDYQGSFRLGYNEQEQALYVAAEVQDESVVTDSIRSSGADAAVASTSSDGCEVWVVMSHEEEGRSSAQWVIWGNIRRSFGAAGRVEDAKVGVRRGKGRSSYEWRLDLARASNDSVKVQPGTVIGFDVVVADKDADGSFSWIAWGRGSAKGTSKRLGDVALVGRDTPMGKLRGRVKSEEVPTRTEGGNVCIQSASVPRWWLQVQADSTGTFEVEIPAGAYQVEGRSRRAKSEVVKVVVETGETVQVREMPLPMPSQGLTVPAGPGKKVPAGNGIWHGAWQTFEVPDGLRGMSVLAVLEDHVGQIWFSTGRGGVSRYDGHQFATFTSDDGLAGDNVSSIVEDREGRLWFGTEKGGVSRYDGHVFTTLTTEDGLASNEVICALEDREGRLWFGTAVGVSRYDGQRFTTFTAHDGLAEDVVVSILEDREGQLWFGTNASGVRRYDGKGFKTFTTKDGLASDRVTTILEDRDGVLWFGTWGGGVSCYDSQGFKTFTTQDGLPDNEVTTILEDRDGVLWFGTWGGGVSRYDGQVFSSFTTADGVADTRVTCSVEDREGSLWFGTWLGGLTRYDGNQVTSFKTTESLENIVVCVMEDRTGRLWFGNQQAGVSIYSGRTLAVFNEAWRKRTIACILEDRKGNLWFGTGQDSGAADGRGVIRYDGERYTAFTSAEGLGNNTVNSIVEDRQGNLWFGTEKGGVSRYDGKEFRTFTTQDGLSSNSVSSVLEARDGQLWFGTAGGASRYDGQGFRTFTTKDGLASDAVATILEGRDGVLWFGTWGGGVSCYDGQGFKTFTTQDGLPNNEVTTILEDRDGVLWFGTWGGGVSRYDGLVFQTLNKQDGLANNGLCDILQDRNGVIWLATANGVTRYRLRHLSPPVSLNDVVADRRYGPVRQVNLPTSQKFIAFEFRGTSFRTRPGQMAYVYQLAGYDEDWRWTKDEKVEYTDLPSGEYLFQVKAVDRDLNYTEAPATVKVTIHPPYGQITLIGGLGLALVGLVFTSGTAIRRRRAFLREQTARLQAQEQLNKELEDELQTAHTLQMDLMPREAPHLPGLDLAGRCIPANHVGGDLFQYFHQDGKLSIALADVTGHAMEAAIPMVMFSGVLKSQIEISGPIEELFGRLNRSLHNAAGSRTFVCFAFGTIDTRTSTLRLSSAAFPYPYHFSAATGEIAELQVDSYPLGVRPDTTYQAIERQLASGDYLVFCSDGIIEATDGTGAQFGYERTAATLRSGCAAGLSAAALLKCIVAEVREFRGETPQGDDQTVVVLKVDDTGSV